MSEPASPDPVVEDLDPHRRARVSRQQIERTDLVTLLSAILERDQAQLGWGLPEPWLQTELYAALKDSPWKPFNTEVPYVTRCPVRLPAKGSEVDIGRPVPAAVKWVDLCLRHEGLRSTGSS